ncbi:MAG TPA: sulfur carrier protein ThiS [Acidimicrobiales bacterium]|nr:sulfur carrier protein ThiS [Acidimicrobiales bacterium]
MTERTEVTVNGAPWTGLAGTTVGDLVAEWCTSSRGIAVARNGDVVPKSSWDATRITSGDRIEIVTAAAGG